MFFQRNEKRLISLNGRWRFRPGPGRKEYTDPGFDDRDWKRMRVPSNWHLAGLEDYHGKVWFRRRFSWHGEDYATLRFNGVDYSSRVWLNGRYLGSHEGYFAPFEFNVSGLLKNDNRLTVEVDSPWERSKDWPERKRIIKGVFGHHDCRPGGDTPEGQRWNTGGIWNSVFLISTGQVKIDNVLIYQKLRDGSATLAPHLLLRNLGKKPVLADILLCVEPPSARGKTVTARKKLRIRPGEKKLHFKFVLPRPKLWWQWDQGPQPLYSFEVGIRVNGGESDRVRGRFGIRKLRRDFNWNWFMNGRRFFPRGTNVIHTQWLSEMTRRKYERDLKLIRECNINFVRVHAHVEREELYELADEMGLLIWQDFPLQWSYDNSVVRRALPMMREMIFSFFNHPSIVVWCCHNEPQEYNLKNLDVALYRLAGRLDPTRYVHLASEFREHPYPGWYHGDYHEYAGLPGAPCPTEFGAQALMNLDSMKRTFSPPDLWPPNWSKWEFHDFRYDEMFRVARVKLGSSLEEFVKNSQEYQARFLKFAVETYRSRKYTGITGIFQFMFVDPWPAITYSVVDYYRKPKAAYFTLKRVYSPIYLILTPPREEFSLGAGFYGYFVVINDYPREFRGARYRWWVESPSGKILVEKRGRIDLPADGVRTVYLFRPMETVKIPEDAEIGVWKVKGQITHGGKVISSNEESFRVVPREFIES